MAMDASQPLSEGGASGTRQDGESSMNQKTRKALLRSRIAIIGVILILTFFISRVFGGNLLLKMIVLGVAIITLITVIEKFNNQRTRK